MRRVVIHVKSPFFLFAGRPCNFNREVNCFPASSRNGLLEPYWALLGHASLLLGGPSASKAPFWWAKDPRLTPASLFWASIGPSKPLLGDTRAVTGASQLFYCQASLLLGHLGLACLPLGGPYWAKQASSLLLPASLGLPSLP